MFKLKTSKRRCISKTQDGTRCKNRTTKTNKCWLHLAYRDNLRIKPSTIPNAGLGLFFYKLHVKRYHKLGRYTGRRTTNRKLIRKIRINAQTANRSTDGALRYANDTRSKATTNIGLRNIAAKSAKKFIPIGET